MMESVLYKLSTLASDHSYLNSTYDEKIIYQKTLAIFTGSKGTSLPTPIPSSSWPIEYDIVQFDNRKPKIDVFTMKSLLVMQFDLELELKEFILAKSTISMLKDVLGDYGENPVALMTVIICKARLLYEEYNKLDTVEEYIHSAGELVAKAYNNTHAISLGNDGTDLRTFEDLYPLRKELVRLKVQDALRKGGVKDKQIVLNKKIDLIWDLLNDKVCDLESWMELTYTYLELGLFKEALWCLGEVLGFESSYVDGWALRGEICYLIGTKMKKANEENWLQTSLHCHLRAVQLDETFIRSWCGIFMTITKMKKVSELNDTHSEIFDLTNRKLKKWQTSQESDLQDVEKINWLFENY